MLGRSSPFGDTQKAKNGAFGDSVMVDMYSVFGSFLVGSFQLQAWGVDLFK